MLGRRAKSGLNVEKLYRSQRNAAFAFALSIVAERQLAEDVVADSFEKVIKKADSFDPARGSAKGWLFTIVRNTALDSLRRSGRGEILVDELPDIAAPDPNSGLDDHPALKEALARLSDDDRTLVYLRFWADLDHKEIAAVLDISPSNVATRLSRVTNRLAETLSQQERI